MIECNYITKEKLEEYGLLEYIPNDRKEYCTHVFNFILDWINYENTVVIHNDEKINFFESTIFAIFYKIIKTIDLTDVEIMQICNEYMKHVIDFKIDETKCVNYIDCETEFMCEFADNKIIELNNNKQ